ncbi:uncharacterized protein C8R40DRAFT_832011 [Lentinula edodes]|uniref:uncharacterized protein n=1 Tax=Lentinula edodes TaxID=5353 RepID=UPI001E8CDE7D|nr:uncharacterized protein C8R40DRAFT_832011 [Lentinula edodes]KAH7878212.1 hypothetical protein C8R40DRAFT_832011 [Lentinula edodes]
MIIFTATAALNSSTEYYNYYYRMVRGISSPRGMSKLNIAVNILFDYLNQHYPVAADMNPVPDSIEFKPSSSKAIVSLFIGLELSGAIGMAVILFTAIFSHQVKRLATWYTFCASWTISCLSYSLLFFAGEINSPEPRKSICVLQAALMYSVPTLTAASTLALLVHSWYNVHFGLSKPPLESNPRVIMTMLSAPFLLWTLLLIGFLSLGIKSPSLVHNFGLYCTFMQILPAKISSLFVIITTFSTIPIQGTLTVAPAAAQYLSKLSRWWFACSRLAFSSLLDLSKDSYTF